MIETVPVFVLCNWMTSSSKKCLANLLSIAVRPSVHQLAPSPLGVLWVLSPVSRKPRPEFLVLTILALTIKLPKITVLPLADEIVC